MIRPPIVTILGHVDHGKTTLLDHIRKSSITTKEHGGITQRIGAYAIDTKIKGYKNSLITFIDTPGHEAFSQLRARGAHVADIAILIIDAKDSLKPQTIESISHIKAANIPFIVALNKMDLPDAQPAKVKKDLLKHEVVTEDHGGDIIAIPISAKKGTGVNDLLESILIIAADQQLTYEEQADIEAFIIETKKDKRGIVASAIIKNGILKTGDDVYAGQQKVRVRSMLDDLGKPLAEARPATPFELLGFSQLPEVGTKLTSQHVAEEKKEQKQTKHRGPVSVEDIMHSAQQESKVLSLIIKADSQGSLDAITSTLSKNEHITIILSAVGGINQSDIFLGKTTKSIVIGFSVPVDNQAKELAKQEKVIIKSYEIIYELVEELEEVSELIREREQQAKNLKAMAKVIASFIIENQTVFGCKITKGKVDLGDKVEIYRNDVLVGESKLSSLRIRAKSVQTVKKDQECGMLFEPALDIKEGDMLKFTL
ncbi:translation initiation factor IF-2 [Candidatus Woesebacteria bacterium]|nr:translation initiation factor IF-2 [Candidatus Woesebacteria bacterium]